MTRTRQVGPEPAQDEQAPDDTSAPPRSSAAAYRLRFSSDNCSIARTIGVVGEKWTFLVLREAFSGIRRFADFQAVTGAPRQVLSARLARLVEEGLMRKVPYREPGQRQRYEYKLTEKGLDLYPIMLALMHWGDRYVADPEGPSIIVRHRDCGAPVRQYLRCDDGHEISGPRETTPTPGPGARLRSA
jgi:DNA-binding HxlR family transcriptional regulator